MFRQSLIYLGVSGLTILVNFLTLPFFTRYLTIADYGSVALFFVVGSIFANFSTIGLGSALYRFYFELKEQDYRVFYSTVMCAQLVLLGVVALVAYPALNWVQRVILSDALPLWSLQLAIVNGVLGYFHVSLGNLMTAQNRSNLYAMGVIIHLLVNFTTLGLLVTFTNWRFEAMCAGLLLANLTGALFFLVNCSHFFTTKLQGETVRTAFRFCYPEVPNLLISQIYAVFDKSMLANQRSVLAVGYFDFGQRFGNVIKLIMDAVSKSWLPFAYQVVVEQPDKYREVLERRFFVMATFFVLVGLGVSGLTEEALILLTTPEFYPARLVTPFIVAFYLIGILGFISVFQINYAKKLLYNLPAAIVGVILNVSLNIVLIPRYGAIGAAIATMLANCCVAVIMAIIGHRVFPVFTSFIKVALFYVWIFVALAAMYAILQIDLALVTKLVLKLTIILGFGLLAFLHRWITIEDIQLLTNRYIKSQK